MSSTWRRLREFCESSFAAAGSATAPWGADGGGKGGVVANEDGDGEATGLPPKTGNGWGGLASEDEFDGSPQKPNVGHRGSSEAHGGRCNSPVASDADGFDGSPAPSPDFAAGTCTSEGKSTGDGASAGDSENCRGVAGCRPTDLAEGGAAIVEEQGVHNETKEGRAEGHCPTCQMPLHHLSLPDAQV